MNSIILFLLIQTGIIKQERPLRVAHECRQRIIIFVPIGRGKTYLKSATLMEYADGSTVEKEAKIEEFLK